MIEVHRVIEYIQKTRRASNWDTLLTFAMPRESEVVCSFPSQYSVYLLTD